MVKTMIKKLAYLSLVACAAVLVIVYAALFNAMDQKRAFDTLAFGLSGGVTTYVFFAGLVYWIEQYQNRRKSK